jgi:hypothetical protein
MKLANILAAAALVLNLLTQSIQPTSANPAYSMRITYNRENAALVQNNQSTFAASPDQIKLSNYASYFLGIVFPEKSPVIEPNSLPTVQPRPLPTVEVPQYTYQLSKNLSSKKITYENGVIADNIRWMLILYATRNSQLSIDDFLKNSATYYGDLTSDKVNWDEVRNKSLKVEIVIPPNEEFNFNETFGKFSSDEGYQSFNNISGFGVCNIASLIRWAAADAGLDVVEAVPHRTEIPGIPRDYQVSIYYGTQNLVIENCNSYPIILSVSVEESKENKSNFTVEIKSVENLN